MTLGKLLTLSVPQLPYLQNVDSHSVHLIEARKLEKNQCIPSFADSAHNRDKETGFWLLSASVYSHVTIFILDLMCFTLLVVSALGNGQ